MLGTRIPMKLRDLIESVRQADKEKQKDTAEIKKPKQARSAG